MLSIKIKIVNRGQQCRIKIKLIVKFFLRFIRPRDYSDRSGRRRQGCRRSHQPTLLQLPGQNQG